MDSGKRKTDVRHVTLESRLRKLMISFLVPILAMMAVILTVLISYVGKYSGILHNVTTASEFNQDFKANIDLKMYYYVVESHYSEGLPIDEVRAAQDLAQSLLNTTTQKESYKAINSVLKLCRNLESKIYLIEATDNYDDREMQLENNIYVLTQLIQEYMYTYLYYEASRLDILQGEMVKRLYIEIALVLLLAFVVLGFATWRLLKFGRSITKPVGALSRRVQSIGDGDLTVRTPIQAREYEIQTLSDGFENMVGRLNQLIEQNRQEQVSLRSAELALLQAQINPHFLYNTLDAIIWLIEMKKNEQAVEMVTSLSSFFRSSLSNGRDIIMLREEEQHVRSYLEIQQVRYKDILSYEIAIDPQISEYLIPKLTLQPLVENALYHGLKQKRGMGHIRVSGKEDGEDLLLLVEDDGAGMDAGRLAALRASLAVSEKNATAGLERSSGGLEMKSLRVGFGVATVHERLQLLFGEQYGLQIDSNEGEGTCVQVRLPKCGKDAVLHVENAAEPTKMNV